jgi:hypothetical protein
MATKQKEELPVDAEKPGRPEVGALITKNVLRSLGKPGNLIRVQVRTLWGAYYRVNVLVGPDVASVKIAHSFFLRADDIGNIVSTTPIITKQY